MVTLRSSFVVLAALVSAVLAQDGDAAVCCEAIADVLPSALELPDTSLYNETNTRYYLGTQALLEPACRVLPASAEEVSQIVTIAAENGCKFAVASGKHWAINYGSNIGQDGFTIDLLRLNNASISDDRKVGSLGPALRAGEVYDFFNPYEVYVGVGRDSDVGVGGFLVGGGMSFISFEHGFGSNTVINFEVVLSSGEIVNANETSNPELFWAIKAGSSNLGIITRFDITAYPLPAHIWAGFQQFSMTDAPALLSQWADAVGYVSEHPNEAGVMLMTFTHNSTSYLITEGFYRNGEANPPLWDKLAGPQYNTTLDTMGNKTFPEFLEEIKLPSTAQKAIWKTFDVKPNGTFALEVWNKGEELVSALIASSNISGLTTDMSVQPMLKSMRCNTYAGPACGGAEDDLMNVLTRIFWDIDGDNGDAETEALMLEWESWIIERATELGLYDDYLFLNYIGSADNNPYIGLPEDTLGRLLDVQATYDPDQIYKDLWKGGFKLPETV